MSGGSQDFFLRFHFRALSANCARLRVVGFLDLARLASFLAGIFWPFFVPVDLRSFPRLAFLILIGLRRRFELAMTVSRNGSSCVCDTEDVTFPQPPSGSSWPNPPHPPHPPKKPRLGLAARIGLIFGGVVILGVVVGLSNQDDPAPVATSSAPTATSAPRATYTAPTYSPPAAPTVAAAPAVPSGPAREITSREWAKIAKSPDQHIGEHLVIYGRVTQFDSITGPSTFRANVDGDHHDQWYEYDTNTFLNASSSVLADVVQDDNFRAEVVVQGSYSYTTAMGGALTVPELTVTKIEVIG
jgi:hypothetical protein